MTLDVDSALNISLQTNTKVNVVDNTGHTSSGENFRLIFRSNQIVCLFVFESAMSMLLQHRHIRALQIVIIIISCLACSH